MGENGFFTTNVLLSGHSTKKVLPVSLKNATFADKYSSLKIKSIYESNQENHHACRWTRDHARDRQTC
ncbi:MAG: hypothetical protein K2L99_00655, partial [Muribaculaceae bacterium]|nr:hypothetical protein [Muribaculaceae bacterium]